MSPKAKRTLIGAGIVLAVVGYALLLWRGPWWLDGGHIRERDLQPADGVVITGVRTALVALGAGIVAGIGLWYTHRSHRHAEKLYQHSREQFEHARDKDREQAELTREGQVTDRYVEAIKLLGSDNLPERLGGIYSLQRIMDDSEKDHTTVVNVLTAYIRHACPVSFEDVSVSSRKKDIERLRRQGRLKPHLADGSGRRSSLPEDIQAALSVIAFRPVLESEAPIDLQMVDLSGAHLIGGANLSWINFWAAKLESATLRSVDLSGSYLAAAKLRAANLIQADLRDAELAGADISGAIIDRASLEGANLNGANLAGTIVGAARLAGVILTNADLRHTDFTGSDLEHATGVTVEQLKAAKIYHSTMLPQELWDHPDVQARIAHCEEAEVLGEIP
ncbi:pentapeptide repeat-containing protein [Streptomyces lydicus]|uniref:pentapeptide repeat-containing protein n=1 Tax=Streptomyces lydicus TaxID=47763 RepID=UPI0036EDFE4C